MKESIGRAARLEKGIGTSFHVSEFRPKRLTHWRAKTRASPWQQRFSDQDIGGGAIRDCCAMGIVHREAR